MGVSNNDEDGGGVDGDGSGAIPRPDRVPEQRFLSLETCLRWRRSYGIFRGWRLIPLGFLRRGQYIGGRAMSVGARGAHTTWWCGQGGARAATWCGHLSALLRLCFGLRDRKSVV